MSAALDRAVLVALFRVTDGASWGLKDNWGTGAVLSTWHGIEVNDQGRVVHLYLAENRLQGSIPPGLRDLGVLNKLSLRGNVLTGTIPRELGNLTTLKVLDLSFNKLNGSIPPELGKLSALEHLIITQNRLTGPIPKDLGVLSELRELSLGSNDLCGPIPPELENLGALIRLSLHGNRFTGTIPRQLGNLTTLKHLSLSQNALDGSIPPELGKLSSLEHLEVCRNMLTGPIPPDLGNLGAVKVLMLVGNELTGVIPRELGNLATLKYLALRSSELDGSIPPELGKLSALEHLDISYNGLTGPMPRKLRSLGDLDTPSRVRNRVTGTIPKELANLIMLTYLNLHSCELRGSIPPELGKLSALKQLDLSHNELTGPIPPELGDLRALQNLWLTENELTGCIPPELAKLLALESLNLSQNVLKGVIPPELGNLPALESLILSHNVLTGVIPLELAKLSTLVTLHLSQNKLTGVIPPELGGLSALESLDLSQTGLTGVIPPELGNLPALASLDLSENRLTDFWDHAGDTAGGGEHLGPLAGTLPRHLRELLAQLVRLGSSRLNLSGNPWQEPPEAVVEKGMGAVSEYFTDLFAEAITVRRNSIKVVLVGQQSAGKTSLRQSIRSRKPTPTSGPQESTVHIDVEEIRLDDVSLRVYDCAGQVAYTGLLQIFLSRRAVSLLVCNAKEFGQRAAGLSDSQQQKQDCRNLEELRVCDWLRSLSFRIPDSTVIVVASKCDLAEGMAADMAGRMERAIREWLSGWSAAGLTAVRVEDGVSLTSCTASAMEAQEGASLGKHARGSSWPCDWRDDMRDDPPPSLLHRIIYRNTGDARAAAMVLPRSWNIALETLDALGNGRDPVESVRQAILIAQGGMGDKEVPAKAEEYKSISAQELNEQWTRVVNTMMVVNPSNALEGALLIREYEGSLVRHQSYVFLDVTWFATILKPLVNHREEEDPIDGSLCLGDTDIKLEDYNHIASWKRLKEEGVLEPELARVMWPNGLSDYVLPTLDALGLTYPLDGDSANGSVVPLRLGKERPAEVGKELADFRTEHREVLGVRWKMFLGVPPGAIEKTLTRCVSIGAIQTFWRFGVLVQGSLGGGGVGKNFALQVEYSNQRTEIDMKVYGNIGTPVPWAALTHGISAVRTMCTEFPGLRWRAFFTCPSHRKDMLINPVATRLGDKLLDARGGCSLCKPETGGLGTAAIDLLQMADVLQGREALFENVNERFVELQRQNPALRPKGQPDHALQQLETYVEGIKGDLEKSLRATEGSVQAELATIRGSVDVMGQRLKQLKQETQEGLGGINRRLNEVVTADDGLMERIDFLVVMQMASRGEEIDTPRRACILPPWDFAKPCGGLTDDEQKPENWVKRLGEWQDDDFKKGKGVFTTDKRLFLVCAQTHRLVPCGSAGHGYDLRHARKWVRVVTPVAKFALQVACSTLGAMLAAPLSGMSAAAEEAVSAGMEMLTGQLGRLRVDGGAAEVDMLSQTQQLEGKAYSGLREFVHAMEDSARFDLAKATKKARRDHRLPPSSSRFVYFADEMTKVQRRDGDADVQWVLKGHEHSWFAAVR